MIDFEKDKPTVPPDYIVFIRNGYFTLVTNVSDEPLFVPSKEANMFMNDVDTVANWHFSRDMDNPQSAIRDKDFDIKLDSVLFLH